MPHGSASVGSAATDALVPGSDAEPKALFKQRIG